MITGILSLFEINSFLVSFIANVCYLKGESLFLGNPNGTKNDDVFIIVSRYLKNRKNFLHKNTKLQDFSILLPTVFKLRYFLCQKLSFHLCITSY